jgi:hypothetical protein
MVVSSRRQIARFKVIVQPFSRNSGAQASEDSLQLAA